MKTIYNFLHKHRPKLGTPLVLFLIFLYLCLSFIWKEIYPKIVTRYCENKVISQIRENASGNKKWKEGKQWIANPIKDDNSDWGWWYPIGGRGSVASQYDMCMYKFWVKTTSPLVDLLND